MAGLLHDIGKIAINEDILNKPGQLTDEKYAEIKRHPESSYKILKSVDLYSPLAGYALLHHERFDGKGYPRGIREHEIPLISRIISVAYAFEAMIADRPYRKGTSVEKALDEIIRNSATQFDPLVVENFIRLFPEHPACV
jgi:HD-GYP domain-containing protein (c-di-GMP phosphodiesterase class II)